MEFSNQDYDYESYDFSNLSSGNFDLSNLSLGNTTDFNYSDSEICDAGIYERTIKVFQSCVFCPIFLLGVVGNCLVIATFALYRRLRLRSMTDVFLFHLALADLLLLLTLPLQAVDTHLGWIFSVALCRATRACYAVNTYSGLLLLACISVDRYMVVARAQEMLRLRSQILTGGKVVAVGVWVVAVLLSLPEILYAGVLVERGEAFCGMLKSGGVKMATNAAIIVVFCVSFVVMMVCYSLIALVLWEGSAHRRGMQWHRQRTLKLMVALVLVFLAFQLPYTVVLSRKMVSSFCDLVPEYVTCTLAYTRCCLNPILYALVGVRFRNDVARLLHDSGCRFGSQPAPQSVGTSVSSPAPASTTVLSAGSTTSPGYYSNNNAAPLIKFQFPGRIK